MSKRLKKVGIAFIPIFLFFTTKLNVSAESVYPPQIVDKVEATSIVSDVFRTLIWWLVYGFHTISSFFERALDSIFKMPFTFLSDKHLIELTTTANQISVLFLIVILLFVGFQVWNTGKIEPLKTSFKNLLIVYIVVVSSTKLLGYSSDLTHKAIEELLPHEQTISNAIITDHLIDVDYVVKNPDKNKLNNFKENFNIDYFDYMKKLDRDKYKKYPVYDPNTNSWSDVELDGGVWGIGQQYVYQYVLTDVVIVILQLAVVTFGFLFASLKFARLVIELGFKKVILLFVGIMDLQSGQRFKRLMIDIGTTFIMMVMVVILFICYTNINTWIGIQFKEDIYVQLIFRIASVLMLLDGPRIIETLFGMDAGISKDGLQAVHYGTSVAKTSVGATKALKNGANYVSDKAKTSVDKVLNTSGQELGVGNRQSTNSADVNPHAKVPQTPIQSANNNVTSEVGNRTNEVPTQTQTPIQSANNNVTGEVGNRVNEVPTPSQTPTQSANNNVTGEVGNRINEVPTPFQTPTQSATNNVTGEVGNRVDEVPTPSQTPTQSANNNVTSEVGNRTNEVPTQTQTPIQSANNNVTGEVGNRVTPSQPIGYKPSIKEMVKATSVGQSVSKVGEKKQEIKQRAINHGLDVAKVGIERADQMVTLGTSSVKHHKDVAISTIKSSPPIAKVTNLKMNSKKESE